MARVCISVIRWLLVTLLFVGSSSANTIIVNTLVDETSVVNSNCTLREAITAANTDTTVDDCAAGSSGMDTINFATVGNITLASSLPAVIDELEIIGPGTDKLGIFGNIFSFPIIGSNTSGIFVFKGATGLAAIPLAFKLQGLTLGAGTNLNTFSHADGNGGCVSLRNKSALVLDHVHMHNCYSSFQGGAIFVSAPAALTTSDRSRLTVSFSHIENNQSALHGGGAFVGGDAFVKILYSTFNNNLSEKAGGGFAMSQPQSALGSNLIIDTSTFSENSTLGARGGGIYLLDTGPTSFPWTADISHSTIVENNAHVGNVPSTPPIFCSTEGAGISVNDVDVTFNIENSIVSANADKDFDRMGCPDQDLFFNIGLTMISTGSTNWIGDVTNGGPSFFVVGSPNADGDYVGVNFPELDILANYGGPTPTRHPKAGSPIISIGSSCNFLEPYDQRGFGFGTGRQVGLACDIGAVETDGQPLLDTDNDGDVDANDNCPLVANATQSDIDGDTIGDACDTDLDGDGDENFIDLDDDGDGSSDVEEGIAGTNPLNPDTDGDGIIDSLDSDPLVASNLCSGMGANASFANVTVTSGNTATCATTNSITVQSTIDVQTGGKLELLSPNVEFAPGFTVKGRLNVNSVDPSAILP